MSPPAPPKSPLFERQDRRRYPRHALSLGGRYLLESHREFACRTIEVSADAISFAAPVIGQAGERVIAYIDELGRLEGDLIAPTERGFAMQIEATAKGRERLAVTLAWLRDRDAALRDERRRGGRIVPRNPFSLLALPDGSQRRCRILDLSATGAALAVDAPVPPGTPVRLRTTEAQVIRRFAGGLALEFLTPQAETDLEERF